MMGWLDGMNHDAVLVWIDLPDHGMHNIDDQFFIFSLECHLPQLTELTASPEGYTSGAWQAATGEADKMAVSKLILNAINPDCARRNILRNN